MRRESLRSGLEAHTSKEDANLANFSERVERCLCLQLENETGREIRKLDQTVLE